MISVQKGGKFVLHPPCTEQNAVALYSMTKKNMLQKKLTSRLSSRFTMIKENTSWDPWRISKKKRQSLWRSLIQEVPQKSSEDWVRSFINSRDISPSPLTRGGTPWPPEPDRKVIVMAGFMSACWLFLICPPHKTRNENLVRSDLSWLKTASSWNIRVDRGCAGNSWTTSRLLQLSYIKLRKQQEYVYGQIFVWNLKQAQGQFQDLRHTTNKVPLCMQPSFLFVLSQKADDNFKWINF